METETSETFQHCTVEEGRVVDMSGIVNKDFYWDANYRIAWVLKETNSGDPDFEICKWLDTYLPIDKKVPRRIALASYGILNDEEDCYGLNPNNYDVKSSLRDIAWINISDESGGPSTSYSRLKYLYRKNRDRVLSILEEVEPNIIILCGICSVLWDDLTGDWFEYELRKLKFYDYDIGIGAYTQEEGDSPLFLETRHPGERSMSDRDYASQIIQAVRAWEDGCFDFAEEW